MPKTAATIVLNSKSETEAWVRAQVAQVSAFARAHSDLGPK